MLKLRATLLSEQRVSASFPWQVGSQLSRRPLRGAQGAGVAGKRPPRGVAPTAGLPSPDSSYRWPPIPRGAWQRLSWTLGYESRLSCARHPGVSRVLEMRCAGHLSHEGQGAGGGGPAAARSPALAGSRLPRHPTSVQAGPTQGRAKGHLHEKREGAQKGEGLDVRAASCSLPAGLPPACPTASALALSASQTSLKAG